MLTVEIDGIWCSKCRTLHPALYWHEKYDTYEMNRYERWVRNKEKRPALFKDAKYIDVLPIKDLEECNAGKCVICGTPTHFRRLSNKHYVCCNECKYADGYE